MKSEISNFLKNLMLSLFIVLVFFYSVSINQLFNGSPIPYSYTVKAINSKHSKWQDKSFAHFDNKLRTFYFEIGNIISLQYDGKEKSFRTNSAMITNLLQEEGVRLNPEDTVNFPLQYVLKDGDRIHIKRVHYKTYSYNMPIPFEVKYEENSLVAKGLKVVWQPGEKGVLKYTVKERYEDGIMVEKKTLSITKTKEPTTEIFALGTAIFTGSFKKKFRMCASSYTPTVEECDSDPFITATGARVRHGIVAVDPKVIKLGSRLWVSGYGYAIAADTGGLIKNLKIDLFFFRRLPDSNWKGAYIDVYLLD